MVSLREKLSIYNTLKGEYINTGIAICRLKDLKDRNLDFDVFLPSLNMNLQRPYVWNLLQQQQLILSTFKIINLPKYQILQYEDSNCTITYKIIDGKQRIITYVKFLNDEFAIPFEGRLYKFSDLEVDDRTYLNHFYLIGDIVYQYQEFGYQPTDQDLIEWFNLINFSGTPQDELHKERLQTALMLKE